VRPQRRERQLGRVEGPGCVGELGPSLLDGGLHRGVACRVARFRHLQLLQPLPAHSMRRLLLLEQRLLALELRGQRRQMLLLGDDMRGNLPC
jgi:hypothetical protein